MIHDFSPFVFKFSDSIGIQWYGLFYLISVFFSYFIVRWFSSRQNAHFTKTLSIDFIFFSGIGLFFGARIGYLLYEPNLFLLFRNDFPYWGVLAIDEGGLSIHGAIFGLFISTFLFSLKSGISQLYLLDLSAIIGSFAIFWGRFASFFSGEYLGRTVQEANGIGSEFINGLAENILMKFPQEILQWPLTHFTKLEKLNSLIEKVPGLSSQIWMESLQQYQENEKARGIVQEYLEKILNSVHDGNSTVLSLLTPFLENRHPVQLYSALCEGLIIFVLLFLLWFKPRKPGVITANFIVLYSVMRIFIEQFALPDAQLGYRWMNVTQAQGLSVLMLILGLWFLFFYGRGGALAAPGWGLGQHVKIHRR
jgi:phosphatidylglycerol:prolipoprotein diacylglycerol transferase